MSAEQFAAAGAALQRMHIRLPPALHSMLLSTAVTMPQQLSTARLASVLRLSVCRHHRVRRRVASRGSPASSASHTAHTSGPRPYPARPNSHVAPARPPAAWRTVAWHLAGRLISPCDRMSRSLRESLCVSLLQCIGRQPRLRLPLARKAWRAVCSLQSFSQARAPQLLSALVRTSYRAPAPQLRAMLQAALGRSSGSSTSLTQVSLPVHEWYCLSVQGHKSNTTLSQVADLSRLSVTAWAIAHASRWSVKHRQQLVTEEVR
jgi:hypothetical protein